MRKFIKLEKPYDIIFESKIYNYLSVDYVYLPIYDGYELLKNQNDNVVISDVIIENKLKKIKSPISGIIKGTTFLNVNNVKTKCAVIENLFDEKEKNLLNKDNFTRTNIIKILSENNYLNLANILENKTIKNLVINGMEDEPYIENNPFILNNYANKILMTLDKITNIFNIDNAFISIKSNDTKNINLFLSKIGTYPKINLSLINDYYLLATDFFLLENMNLSNDDSIIISANEIYKIYKLLTNEYYDSTFICISSPFLEKNYVVNVKYGTLLDDVFKKLNISFNEDVIYVCNGLMKGFEIDPKKEVITENMKGVIIIKKEEITEKKCNNCGMCYKICPVKVNPKKVMDTKIKSKNCINCGLCTYICPCKINLRSFLENSK